MKVTSRSIRTIAEAVDVIATSNPTQIAIRSPFQSTRLTYKELSEKTNSLACWLSTYGFEKKDVLVSDLPNVCENIVLQIACNRLGVRYGTAKNLESMAKQFPKVKGAVSANPTGFLAQVVLEQPYLSGEFIQDLIFNGGLDDFPTEDIYDEGDETSVHAFYNSATPYTNQQALTHGRDAVEHLSMTEHDTICVSITLCHAFGMGSAVSSALLAGASIALPAVGGIQGCGVPSERASATLQTLESEDCTLLFADTHTLTALPEPSQPLQSLRGGVVKVGSGSSFLKGTLDYSGVTLSTIGQDESV